MQLSQIPTMVPLPFAENGTKNTIPEASQIGVTPGAASLNDGFPPLTFTPLAAGGIPPAGADFNGILNLLSANTQWQNAGGFSLYVASFAAAIGGYPKTALLAKISGNGYWLNLEDGNPNDPDTGGEGWLAFDPWAFQAAQYITAPDTGVVNACAVDLNPTPAALAPGMLVSITSIFRANTGAATLAVNGLSTLPILLSQNTPLSGGELIAGYGAIVQLNNSGTAWELIWTGAGSFGIAATQSNAAVVLGQMTNGNLNPTFGDIIATAQATTGDQTIGGTLAVTGTASAAAGTTGNDLVNFNQFGSIYSTGGQHASGGNNNTASSSVSFTAPCDGWCFFVGSRNDSSVASSGGGATLYFNGNTILGDNTLLSTTHMGAVYVTGGEVCTATYTATSTVAFSANVGMIFIPNTATSI